MSFGAAILFFFVLPGFSVVAGVLIYQYLRSLFRLVERIENTQPALWRQLGSPRMGEMDSTGVGHPRGTQYYVQPFMPLFRWLLAGEFQHLDRMTRDDALRTRRLFFFSGVAFAMVLAVFMIFIALVEQG